MKKPFFLFYAGILTLFVSCGSGTGEEKSLTHQPGVEEKTRYYSGTIGEYGIIMKLDLKGDEVTGGSYYYLSKCIPIPLTDAERQGDKIVMNEKTNGELTGTFFIEWDEENIKGEWMAFDKSKLPLSARLFSPRKDQYEIQKNRHNYTNPNEYGYGFSTTNIDLTDSSGKKTDNILIHHKMYDHTWEEWQQMMKEAENSDEMYQGLSHFWDTVYTDFYDLLSVYSTTCEIAAREHCNEHYELFDAQKRKFLTGDDFLRKENFSEFEKLYFKKVNLLIDGMIKELKDEKENALHQDESGYDIDMVIETLGYSRDNKKVEEWNTKSLMLEKDKVVFVYDFSLYFMPVELYIPQDRVEFSVKEIAPFLKPEGPLNFLLTEIFE